MKHRVTMSKKAAGSRLAKQLNFLLRPEDADSLRLATAADGSARLCRAWLLQGWREHPDHEESAHLLSGSRKALALQFLERALPDPPGINFGNTHPWQYFCPPAAQASSAPDDVANEISRRRHLSDLKPAPHPLRDPASELLFTTNALVSPPLDAASPNIPEPFRDEARRFADCPQNFWYDHPVPLDAAPGENEILYGLARLDEALAEECRHGTLPTSASMDLAMSISVTHEGMETLASDYVRNLITRHLKLRHLRVFLFDETHCRRIVGAICPGERHASSVFGVNGAYGRHYSFLKAVLLLWQMAVNPKVRFSFKIDLDQVFDQSALRAHTGKTALQLLCNPHWGGQATDYLGRNVDLGMLAGGLVNQSDSQHGLFVPDVVRPNTSVIARQLSSKRVFCPQWPQAVSTEAEIMQRGADYQRIHVTGGTTGICDTALRAWQPFTPSFINRAEDQAFGLSALGKDSYLAHLHAPGLIMRHDKQAFAARAIAHADAGKAIGDIERIMLFSRYAELHVQGFDAVQNHLWPFTACFLHPTAPALAAMVFALDGATKGGRYVDEGARRLTRCLDFCQKDMADQLVAEQAGWRAIYDALRPRQKRAVSVANVVADAMIEKPD